jgi:hypothetical protein
MTTENEQGVVQLPAAGVPADQGLSSLGLLMQLAGSVLAAYAALGMFVMLFALRAFRGGDESLFIFLILGLCIARSAYHRIAGTELLYGRKVNVDGTPGNPLAGMRRYIIVALGQSLFLVLIFVGKFHMPATFAIGIGLGLAAWPGVLLAMMASGRFAPFKQALPVAEDKGFEGAAILMTVLGLCGVLLSGTILFVLFDAGGRALSQGPGVLLMLALVMLVIRSIIHVQAGLSGLRETSVDRAVELANRYANFGVISSFCAGGALMLIAMTSRLDLSGLALVAGVCWMLMAWPTIIRRFFSDRQFADLLAGDNASVHRRAPDAGLTGLGWLLLAHAIFTASFLIPQLVIGQGDMPRKFSEILALAGPMGMRSLWWSAGLVMLQSWAAYELIRMGPQHKLIARVYSGVAIAVTVYLFLPAVQMFRHARGLDGKQMMIMMLGPIAISLVIPIATFLLVNRSIAPTARARFRSKQPPPQPPA